MKISWDTIPWTLISLFPNSPEAGLVTCADPVVVSALSLWPLLTLVELPVGLPVGLPVAQLEPLPVVAHANFSVS
jgi:hypothetical protein